MKKIYLLSIFMLLLKICVIAQNDGVHCQSDDPEIKRQFFKGLCYIDGVKGLEKSMDKALEIFEELSEEHNEGASQYFAALIYQHEKNYVEAIKYFKKASKNGVPFAFVQLGYMVKHGMGSKVDYKKAVKYYKQAADNDVTNGQYLLGYSYYKGFGIKQNYAEAFRLFSIGESRNHPPSLFMLGLMYEYGVGVDEDMDTALDYYDRSASSGFDQAIVHLERINAASEKSLEVDKIEVAPISMKDIPSKMITIEKISMIAKKQFIGKWQGLLVRYDWSGEKVLKKTPMELVISDNGNKVEVIWNTENNSRSSIADVDGNMLRFSNMSLMTEGSHGGYVEKEIRDMTLTLEQSGDTLFLKGNVTNYLPGQLEPDFPNFIVLKQVSSSDGTGMVENLTKSEAVPELYVYPNPFHNVITIDYELYKESDVIINLYNTAGKKIKTVFEKKNQVPGNYSFEWDGDVPSGNYLLIFQVNGDVLKRKIIKN